MATRIQRWDSVSQSNTVYPKNYNNPQAAFRDLGERAATEMFDLAENDGKEGGKIKYIIKTQVGEEYCACWISVDGLFIEYATIEV